MIKCSLCPILLLFIITAIVAVIVSSHCGCNAENFREDRSSILYDRLIMHPCNESLKEIELTVAKHTARVPRAAKYFISNEQIRLNFKMPHKAGANAVQFS